MGSSSRIKPTRLLSKSKSYFPLALILSDNQFTHHYNCYVIFDLWYITTAIWYMNHLFMRETMSAVWREPPAGNKEKKKEKKNLLAAVHRRRLSSHSPECQGPLNQIQSQSSTLILLWFMMHRCHTLYRVFFSLVPPLKVPSTKKLI